MENLNIIDFVLTFNWFDKIKSGEKRNEYRKVSTWEKRLKSKIYELESKHKPLALRLRRGYTKTFMLYSVDSVSCRHGSLTDLKCNELVYDFKLGILINSN